MRSRPLFAFVSAWTLVLSLGCNSNNRIGDVDCSDPADCPEACLADPASCQNADSYDSIRIQPAPVLLTSNDGSRPTQQLVAKGARHSDGKLIGPLDVQFSVPGNSIGSVDAKTGLFTASGEVGGTITVTARMPGKRGPLTASVDITVNIVRTHIVAGTPADAGTKFGNPPVFDVSKSARIAYPLNGVVMPQNVYPADIQWTQGTANDIYRITLKKPNATVVAYTLHSGGGFGYDYLPQGPAWSGIAQSNPDTDAIVSVDRWDAASGTVYSGDVVKMRFAKGSLLGSIYYWDITATRIRRIDDGSAKAVDFMPTPPTSPIDGSNCVGCHGVSRDGRYMLGRLGGGNNVAGVFDLTKDLTVAPAPSEYPISSALTRFFISSWSPDNKRLIANELSRLLLINPQNGMEVTPAAGSLPTVGALPNWSPDGKNIVYVSNSNDWGGTITRGDLSIIPVTGPDSFGASTMIHSAASIPGTTADTWPSWSPDSKWIAFQSGTNSRSDAAIPGSLQLISPDGAKLIRLTNATGGQTGTETVFVPNFSPFNVGGYFWLTFITQRPYGNAQVGTAGAPKQQLWVAAISNDPQSGKDPSCVPYWLPGQATSSKNISAFWAPKACRLTGEACTSGTECCSTLCSMGTCQPPPPDRCRQRDESCGGSGDCCVGLSCNATTHVCEGQIG